MEKGRHGRVGHGYVNPEAHLEVDWVVRNLPALFIAQLKPRHPRLLEETRNLALEATVVKEAAEALPHPSHQEAVLQPDPAHEVQADSLPGPGAHRDRDQLRLQSPKLICVRGPELVSAGNKNPPILTSEKGKLF